MAFALTPLLYMSVLSDLPLTLRASIGLSSAARVERNRLSRHKQVNRSICPASPSNSYSYIWGRSAILRRPGRSPRDAVLSCFACGPAATSSRGVRRIRLTRVFARHGESGVRARLASRISVEDTLRVCPSIRCDVLSQPRPTCFKIRLASLETTFARQRRASGRRIGFAASLFGLACPISVCSYSLYIECCSLFLCSGYLS
jgi:hypothetical protein